MEFGSLSINVDGAYYRYEPLSRQLLPAIRNIASDVFIGLFQRDNGPAHRTRPIVEPLSREMPLLVGLVLCPPNSPDLNLVDSSVWGSCSNACNIH